MINTNLVAKAHDVVFHIGYTAPLGSADGGAAQAATDHLAVQDYGIGRTSDEHFVGVRCVKPSGQYTIVAQDLEFSVAKRLNDVFASMFRCCAVHVGCFDAEIRKQRGDEARMFHVAGEKENPSTFSAREE